MGIIDATATDAPMTGSAHIDTLRVPAELSSLARVRSTLEGALERSSWPEGDASRVMLAAGEAVCNAIEHGSVPTGTVTVSIHSGEDGVTLVVTDEGDPGRPPRLNLGAEAPPSSSIRGRGIMIMRELADEIALERHGTGTRVAMFFAPTGGSRDPRAA